MTITTISKWGNSKGIHLPKKQLEQIGIFEERQQVTISVEGNRIVIEKYEEQSPLAKRFSGFDLDQYFAQFDANESLEFDAGQPQGREQI
ncbi:AbrB/MazE/SpoVT family DNA-binding domain-containing protein [Levilactobacillus bambusae]|uniref:AbrB family transcriptional regulator n=1 Tax=Levilactobacillus bambusae TaxID=2024736 RepID=A0A2V1MXB8_9LACO|nr:AbrB family transcriptional regulator [Levilactobacillus bambusae]PWF99501.1 AbrB family transcriptional regulator [Levilactobacillus bambusae]